MLQQVIVFLFFYSNLASSYSTNKNFVMPNSTTQLEDAEPISTNSTSKSPSCECSNYKFRLTPVGGNFGEARQMCRTLGGDLISKNLGPEGKDYHGIIRAMLPEPGRYWVGVTDIEHDGVFNLLDGRKYDPSDLSQSHLYYWDPQEPNYYEDELCVEIILDLYSRRGLADVNCYEKEVEGIPRLGLCEICVD